MSILIFTTRQFIRMQKRETNFLFQIGNTGFFNQIVDNMFSLAFVHNFFTLFIIIIQVNLVITYSF